MRDKVGFLRPSLEDVELEKEIMKNIMKSMDDTTLAIRALTDTYYTSKRILYIQEVKRRVHSSNLFDIQEFFNNALDCEYEELSKYKYSGLQDFYFNDDYEIYDYSRSLRKKRVPEV